MLCAGAGQYFFEPDLTGIDSKFDKKFTGACRIALLPVQQPENSALVNSRVSTRPADTRDGLSSPGNVPGSLKQKKGRREFFYHCICGNIHQASFTVMDESMYSLRFWYLVKFSPSVTHAKLYTWRVVTTVSFV